MSDPDPPPRRRDSAAAFAVHLLTASGALWALLAAVFGASGNWPLFWLWLGIALFVDAIDGPLARKLDVERRLPYWSGEVLDLVIDYVTYVFLPALAIPVAGIISGWAGLAAAGVIVITGALYFADTRMKLADNQFRGFPAAWNMVVFVLAVAAPGDVIGFAVIVLSGALTFVPVGFIHPVRVKGLRPVTLAVTLLWAICAFVAIVDGLEPVPVATVGLVVASVYLYVIGALLQLHARLLGS